MQVMSDPYQKAKGGRLMFKGGSLATRSKSIDKLQKKKKKNKKNKDTSEEETHALENEEVVLAETVAEGGEVYTIDASKRMKYDELFPVEAKKFGYDPKSMSKSTSVEDALDDRVKKKADRYCK